MNNVVLTYLILGHAVAEFGVWPSTRRKQNRPTATSMLVRWRHVGRRAVIIPAVALPVLGTSSVRILVVAVLGSLVIEAVLPALTRRLGSALAGFLLGQAAHFAVLLVASRTWNEPVAWMNGWFSLPQPGVSMAPTAMLVAAFIVAGRGGGRFVTLVLNETRERPAELSRLDASPRLGRVIGVLERLVIVLLALVEAWGGIGLILAAKSIARFKELEHRTFAEYYLVGTLSSVLWAIGAGLGATLLVDAAFA